MMRRKQIELSVGRLEGRLLLSGISYTLTTDQSTYQVGQPIQISFTETNTGDQPATVSLSPTDFSVSEQSTLWNGLIWQSNPENAGQAPTSVTLQPGQSVSQTATWDGTVPASTYQQSASSLASVNQFGTFSVSNPNALQGETATFQITNPLQGSLTTNQATYLGQPVQLTYTETNTSSQALTIIASNPPLYQIMHDGQPVLPIQDPIGSTFDTISPGQTITSQYTYHPPGFGPYTLANMTGAFVAEVYNVPAAPGEFTADFQIVPPPAGAIVSSVTTDQPVYQVGQTVTMTLTETNVSDQPVTIVTGQNGFEFDQPSPTLTLDLEDLPATDPTGWSTLQPGQSWTQTETWSSGNPVAGTYTLEISNVFDPNGNTAQFELLSASSLDNTSTSGNGDGTGQIAPLTSSRVTTNRADYLIGESVRISLKVPGNGSAEPSTAPLKSREQITVLDGTQLVYRITRRIPAFRLKQLEAGRTVILTMAWNGRPDAPGIHSLKPGSYTIDGIYGDYRGSTAIALHRKGS